MIKFAEELWAKIRRAHSKDGVRFEFRATVTVVLIIFLIIQRTFWTPDTLLVLVVIIGIVFGKTRQFILRFVPFLGMLVVYDSMRSIADDLNKNVHFMEMINWDRWVFGGELPTVVLQRWWWDGQIGVLEFYFYFLYTLHFLVPLIVGLVLWKFRPRLYWPFVWALVGISFVAFITYVAFPAAPPWMASKLGYIAEPLHRVSSEVWGAMGMKNFSEIYAQLSPNQVAAVPSLHSAYPLIASLFMIAAFGFRRMWWLLIYPLSMWVGIVYLGEHYVFDIAVGVVYVVAGVLLVRYGFRKYRHHRSRIDAPQT